MSSNKESLRRCRRRKTVIGPRQELRRIKERVDFFLLQASQQANQQDNQQDNQQYRQLQTSDMDNVLSSVVNSRTLDMMVPLVNTTHAQSDGNDQQQTEIHSLHYEQTDDQEAHSENQQE
ncbi:Uncharacterized protein APZ42_000482, partial [Daphnia magna]